MRCNMGNSSYWTRSDYVKSRAARLLFGRKFIRDLHTPFKSEFLATYYTEFLQCPNVLLCVGARVIVLQGDPRTFLQILGMNSSLTILKPRKLNYLVTEKWYKSGITPQTRYAATGKLWISNHYRDGEGLF
jgi:hypothetical protein